MSKTYGQPCPVAHALDAVGDRWALLVVRDLLDGPRRFGQLATTLGGIAPNMLSARLQALEERQVVERRLLDGRPPQAEYALTPAGRELGPVVAALASWGSRHTLAGAHLQHSACGHDLEVRLHCAHCARDVEADERRIVRAAPRGHRRKA